MAQAGNNKAAGQAVNNKMATEFINAAKAFESAEIVRVHKSAKIAWRICGACLLITGLSVGAVAGLTPLKETRPYVVKVDNNTGLTEIVTVMKTQEQSYGEVIDKHFLNKYIQYRESYDWVTIQDSYDATMLMSSPEVQAAYAQIYNDNPQAPHKILKNQYKVVAKVKAITFIGKTAQIRFEKRMIPVTGDLNQEIPVQNMIATVGYEYVSQPMSEEARRINPLGFQVKSYRVDPETAP
ncbi:VirB8 family type IV secretion system protein [Neisseria chenwenguii]|uniref:Type VI secretion protein n=1 Tax=Neisseria chenwenguii TaxID=1853278 RepID=A0A220S1C5_9NEIS|nr:type IV secretion system protein [Neisseria chenwenguii]ASK27168.1 type VI secretion protein [Neisseria chenwenguii]ROV56571.1 type IV secretion system protein [Neisseria chenwenguii]